jgi:uncharacterized membrane protein YhaH (DUF805 family)
VLAIPIENRRLSRAEYWKRILLMFLASVVWGALIFDLPDYELQEQLVMINAISIVLQIYWGVGRCRDIGWNPWWAILNFSVLAVIIFGIPQSKIELRLA